MEKQIEILTRFSQLAFDSANSPFEGAILKVTVDRDEGWAEADYRYYQSSKLTSDYIQYAKPGEVMQLAYELQDIMFEHTGGRWKWFTLELNKNGQATTHFEY